MSSVADLKSLLENIQNLSGTLHNCLRNENQALTGKDYQALLTVAEEKQQLIDRLNELDQQRERYCAEREFGAFLNKLDNSQQLSGIWEKVRQTVKQCRDQNEINGRLLQRQNRITRETMELLTGRTPSSDTTYGPNGMTKGNNSMLSDVEA